MRNETRLLSTLLKGETAIIDSFLDEQMKQKLLEMGCLPGEKITIGRFAALGGPMAVIVNGSMLGIRMDEADAIVVKPEVI